MWKSFISKNKNLLIKRLDTIKYDYDYSRVSKKIKNQSDLPGLFASVNKIEGFVIKKRFNILRGLLKRSINSCTSLSKPFTNLYSIIDVDLLVTAYLILKKNSEIYLDNIHEENLLKRLRKLSEKIKNKKFRWSRQEGILKTKSIKTTIHTFVGIPDFEDQIVQKAIAMVLESIYEPIFESLDCNYGFRKFKGTHDAIKKIYLGVGSINQVIQGDTEFVFEYMEPEVLNKILCKKINDKNFITLIMKGLQCGSIHYGSQIDTLLEIPQGGICFPILFNVYMHALDVYIMKDIKFTIKMLNKKRIVYNNLVKNLKYKLIQNKIQTKQVFIRNHIKKDTIIKFNYYTRRFSLFKVYYIRFAGSWIILHNGNKILSKLIINKIESFLKTTLKLQLPPEKIFISNPIENFIKFLGFSIMFKTYQARKINKYCLPKNIIRPTIDIDLSTLFYKLVEKGYCCSNLKPKSMTQYTVFTDWEIIKRYNFVMLNLCNYYYPVLTKLSQLSRVLGGILYYSAIMTLAHKHKSTLSKITKQRFYTDITKLGLSFDYKPSQKVAHSRMRIVIEYSGRRNKKYIVLLNYLDLLATTRLLAEKYGKNKIKYLENFNTDFLNLARVNLNYYSRFEFSCLICGSQDSIEHHHINYIKKYLKIKFKVAKILLNKKQILVCHTCHKKLHVDKYEIFLLKYIWFRNFGNIVTNAETKYKNGKKKFSADQYHQLNPGNRTLRSVVREFSPNALSVLFFTKIHLSLNKNDHTYIRKRHR